MKNKKNLKKETKIGIAIIAALLLAGIVDCVLSFIVSENRNEPFSLLHIALNTVLYIFVGAYTFFDYKRPHGNSLRILFFVFGVYVLLSDNLPIVNLDGTRNFMVRILAGLAALFTVYISGRLDKLNKNRLFMIAVGVLLLAGRIIVITTIPSNLIRIIGVSTQFIVWLALCLSYTIRFDEHKAAGLE